MQAIKTQNAEDENEDESPQWRRLTTESGRGL